MWLRRMVVRVSLVKVMDLVSEGRFLYLSSIE